MGLKKRNKNILIIILNLVLMLISAAYIFQGFELYGLEIPIMAVLGFIFFNSMRSIWICIKSLRGKKK